MDAFAETVDYPSQAATATAGKSFPDHSIAFSNLHPGAAGIFQALDAMASCVRGECPPDFSGFDDGWVRQFADGLVSGIDPSDSRAHINAIFDFVKNRITYQLHPPDQQVVQDCRRTIEIGAGDCVSKSVCLATLLTALEFPVRFVAQAPDGSEYAHVYCEAQDAEGNLIGLDPVAENQAMGWTQPLPDGGFETTSNIF